MGPVPPFLQQSSKCLKKLQIPTIIICHWLLKLIPLPSSKQDICDIWNIPPVLCNQIACRVFPLWISRGTIVPQGSNSGLMMASFWHFFMFYWDEELGGPHLEIMDAQPLLLSIVRRCCGGEVLPKCRQTHIALDDLAHVLTWPGPFSLLYSINLFHFVTLVGVLAQLNWNQKKVFASSPFAPRWQLLLYWTVSLTTKWEKCLRLWGDWWLRSR